MLVAVRGRCCTLLLYRPAARLVARPGELLGTGSPTVRFSGRTYPPVGTDRARVMRRRSLMTAVGSSCSCHRCCQRLVLFPISVVSRLMTAWRPGPGRHLPACFRQPGRAPSWPRPSPEPDSCRTIRQTGSVRGRRSRSRVTPKAPLTGSGCREHSYGGFGGGHPHFHPHAPGLTDVGTVRPPASPGLS